MEPEAGMMPFRGLMVKSGWGSITFISNPNWMGTLQVRGMRFVTVSPTKQSPKSMLGTGAGGGVGGWGSTVSLNLVSNIFNTLAPQMEATARLTGWGTESR